MAVLCAAAALLPGNAAKATADSGVSSIRATEWWLDSMHAPDQVWKVSTGSGITVAVIDSGVNANHPDLVGKVLPGQNFSKLSGGATTDADGHGTGMASFIVGQGRGWNGQGMYGLAPGATVLPYRVVKQGANEAVASADFSVQLSAALRAAADSDAKIISISQGQPEDDPNVRNAVAYAFSKGKLIVAAVGNDGKNGNPVNYPAGIPGVLGVAATDSRGQVTAESESGPQVALTADGDNMHNACVGPSGYCWSHGTSDSAALVSASAALLWSVHPSWTANQVIRVLINTANAGGKPGVHDDHFGYGVIRPRIALATPGDPGAADVNPLIPVAATTAPPATSTPAATAGQAAPQAAKQSTGSSSSSSVLWIAIGAAVVVLAGAVVAFILIRRRNRPGPPPTPPTRPNPYAHLPNP
ncbi:type VII secretion-associated serine protease mycosin [Streptacidiphilus sp. MAP12-16]|uniref:type VII secretion-associated serine protease mycosin n=1 Tax=Streptacidiphilus sp. MAP12-16 TaxID=3156300 RepID=UPI0035118853